MDILELSEEARGELGANDVYPLVRYDFAEETIWANGGQAITSMVLTGTPGYPNA